MAHCNHTGLLVSLLISGEFDPSSYSIASGCPPHYSDRALASEQASWLISLPDSLPGDQRLAATFEYEELSRMYILLVRGVRHINH